VVSGDLLDIWLHEGFKGLEYLKQSKAYAMTDPYVKYVEKYELVKSCSQELGQSLGTRYEDLNQKVVLFVDETKKIAGLLVNVLSERQAELLVYLEKTYSNVAVFVQENWLRLDFNNDGTVSMDDLRANLKDLYEFLKSYDYIEATTRIKSTIYE
jgi:hypothetical protein